MLVFSQNLESMPTARPGDEVRLAWASHHSFGLAADDGTAANDGAPHVVDLRDIGAHRVEAS
jgi:hypothetical protein